jgi:putative redox protein
MTVKIASVTFDGDDLRFVGRTGSGHSIVLDSASGDTGMRPAELVPLAVAGCTAMDVLSILRKKRQAVRHYAVEARGTQTDDHPNAFLRIDVTHHVEGEAIDPEAVRRAIELSATRYCAVSATLSSGITEIHHAYVLRDATGAERSAEVIVLGPSATPGQPAEPAAPAVVAG